MMQAYQATCVAMAERGLLIEGPPGSGKSSLALALVDRGAMLVGDDSVLLGEAQGRLCAFAHPNTRGLIEVRNLGLLHFPVRERVPVALVIRLDHAAPRFIEAADSAEIAGFSIPLIQLHPDSPVLHLRAELALEHYGLPG